jgi:hypothetical protein
MKTLLFVAAAAIMFCAGGAASADTIDLVAIHDATIFSESLAGANGQGHLFAGRNLAGDLRRALLRFDLGGIPAGSLITGATLTMQCTNARPGSWPMRLHRVTTAWTEGPAVGTGMGGGKPGSISALDVTWVYASFLISSQSFWTTQGGDFDTTSATTTVGGIGSYQWSSDGMVDEIQLWVDTPASNFGWILIGDEANLETARRFDSGEDATPPTLTVDFTPPTPVETTTWGRVKALYRP